MVRRSRGDDSTETARFEATALDDDPAPTGLSYGGRDSTYVRSHLSSRTSRNATARIADIIARACCGIWRFGDDGITSPAGAIPAAIPAGHTSFKGGKPATSTSLYAARYSGCSSADVREYRLSNKLAEKEGWGPPLPILRGERSTTRPCATKRTRALLSSRARYGSEARALAGRAEPMASRRDRSRSSGSPLEPGYDGILRSIPARETLASLGLTVRRRSPSVSRQLRGEAYGERL